jgi:hypothetical protein
LQNKIRLARTMTATAYLTLASCYYLHKGLLPPAGPSFFG